MKTLRFLLIALVAQICAVTGIHANSFKDMYIIMVTEQTERIPIPEQMDMVDLTQSGREGVFMLGEFSIKTAAKASKVNLQYKVYAADAETTGEWILSATGDMNDMGTLWANNPYINLLEGLDVGGTYILEFRMQGQNEDGTMFYYDNGGQNYKVKFIKDNAPKVTFAGGKHIASVLLTVDDKETSYYVPNDVWNGVDLGKTSSLVINAFEVSVEKHSNSIDIDEIRINYGLCKKGEDVDFWYATPSTNHILEYESGNYSRLIYTGRTAINIMERLSELYPDGLIDGTEYELCIGFDFDDGDGNNMSLDNSGEGFRFPFIYSETQLGPDDRAEFTYSGISLDKNGEYTYLYLHEPANYNLDLTADPRLWGLTLTAFSTYPSYESKEVKLNYRMYEGTTPQGEWKQLSTHSSGNMVVEWSYKGDPIDLLEGTQIGKTYTFEYYISGITITGKPFYHNNGGNNFTIKFSPTPATEHFNFVTLNATVGLGGDTEETNINLPPNNMQPDDMSNAGRKADNVFTLNSWAAETSTQFTNVDMYYSVYPSDGTAGEWKQIAGTSADRLAWTSTATADFTAGLEKGKTYTLEFYIKGIKDSEEAMFNNDGQNYKVQFLYDDKSLETGFIRDGRMSLSVNGEWLGLSLPDCIDDYVDGAVQLGDVTSIGLMGYMFTAHRENTSAEITGVSLQYRAYEPGQSGQWNGIETTSKEYANPKDPLDMRASFYAETPYLFTGLEPGKTYILELLPQMTTSDGKYYFFSATEEEENVGFKFKFNYGGVTGIASVSANATGNAPAYNLAGQRVADGYKGIVIVGGRKVMQ